MSRISVSRSRRAFTLIELLVVITIIMMLAGMSLGAVYAARESARATKTKATIAKLDVIIQAKYAEFFTRRLPIKNLHIPADGMAELKFRTLHEIMRMEMPDRIRDVTYPISSSGPGTGTVADMTANDLLTQVHPLASFADQPHTTRFYVDVAGTVYASLPTESAIVGSIERPSVARRYWQNLYKGKDRFDPQFDSAECLYMIVNSDRDAREQFRPDEVGDSDGDGFLEFHDGWDRPILWLRWAPAFVDKSDLMTGDTVNDVDPMNQQRISDLVDSGGGKLTRPGPATYRLVPLIYSGGPDKKYGIYPGDNWVAQFAPGDSMAKVWLDGRIGLPDDDPTSDEFETYLDNITNHSVGME